MNEFRWSELYEGLSVQFVADITCDAMAAFATLSGDVNPLHTDVTFARQSGFDDKVAYGMLTSALYSQLVGVHLPGKFALLQGIDIDFKAPAYAGSQLTVQGEIQYLNHAYKRIEIVARIVNAMNVTISKAQIRVGLLGG